MIENKQKRHKLIATFWAVLAPAPQHPPSHISNRNNPDSEISVLHCAVATSLGTIAMVPK
jgi:hypothetical protein